MSVDVKILDGRLVAKSILNNSKKLVQRLKDEKSVTPCLATILVGDDPASTTYVNMKGKKCDNVGALPKQIILPASITTQDLVNVIVELNKDKNVHGILLQHPVPSHIDEPLCFETISVDKDVDGVTSHSFGRFSFKFPAFGCCTPYGIMRILEYYDIDVTGMDAVVVGRSTILGQPMSMMLMNADATVTICHSKTKKLSDIVKRADLVVAAVGRPEFIKGSWIKKGAIVIDAGYNEGNVGDVEYEAAYKRASRITPVPGGVGPCTIATLIDQGVIAAARQNGLNILR